MLLFFCIEKVFLMKCLMILHLSIEKPELNLYYTDIENEIVYKCTWPRCGSYCQYELLYDYPNNISLSKLIYHYLISPKYKTNIHTCYIHLKCYRGLYPACLDWTEICDGKIDCIENEIVEEYC